MDTLLTDLIERGAILGFTGRERFLSNFWPCEVRAYDRRFPSVEHAFAAAKVAPGPGAMAHVERIARFHNAAEARRYGKTVPLRPDWDAFRFVAMGTLLRRKFSDAGLRSRLAATGERPLVELNTWGDRTWGAVSDGRRVSGLNRLGFLLEEVRAEL